MQVFYGVKFVILYDMYYLISYTLCLGSVAQGAVSMGHF